MSSIFLATILFLIISCLSCSKIKIKRKGLIDNNIPNWTMYGGNPQRTNSYINSLDFPLDLIWHRKASAAIERTIIVVDSVIYFGTKDGKIQAIHIQTGQKLGEKKVEIAATCAYQDHHLIIARRYGDDTLYNLDLNKGKFSWHINAGDISSEPLVTPTSVIVTALYKHIDLYRLDSGEKIWTYETDDQIRSSPAMTNRKIVYGCDDGYVYAVDSGNGKLLWKFKTNGSVQSIPTIDAKNKIVYFGSSDFYCYAVKLNSGEEIWKFKTNGQIINGAALSDQKIIFGSTDNKIYCLHTKTGKLLWQFAAKSVVSTSPLIAGDVVIWGSLDKFFYAISIENGQLIWKYKAKGRIRTAPVVWGNYLICASENNHLYVFKPKQENSKP